MFGAAQDQKLQYPGAVSKANRRRKRMTHRLQTPFTRQALAPLRAGDEVLLDGVIYTARDAAHARLVQLLEAGAALPFALPGACIYYAGPTPAPPGRVIGAVGPTTAGRMDGFAPRLLEAGLLGMVGKGRRSAQVLAAMRRAGAVYFGYVGGAGALAAARITACQTIAFEDLGSEAVRRLTVKDFPLTVLADAAGGDLYQSGPAAYLAWKNAQKCGENQEV
ncbi:FumA C-terminus/TtdB family hydratase beta subunit [Ruminococcaceae bacterium OttesenSCG-928-O06]|nr:FumA C-terminus/TtdB family hydratase beta subunit [Ruminococcaceae bacterium OttesenSCG-928-O06]